MNKYSFYLILLNLLFFSCEKDIENNELKNRLIGKWKLIKSCGGYTGDCWDSKLNEKIEFTQKKIYFESNNIIFRDGYLYHLVDSSTVGSSIKFKIVREDNKDFDCYLSGEKLSINIGDVWNTYQKK